MKTTRINLLQLLKEKKQKEELLRQAQLVGAKK
jgi:hypothetical protein